MSSLLFVFVALVFTAYLKTCDAATYGCSNTGLTDSLRDQFLDYHNDARQRVAKGTEANKVGLLNPAKNMYRLSWDCAMEQQVQDAISTCSGNLGSWTNMGQNLIKYTSSGLFNDPPGSINASLNNWWGKAKLYGVTDPQNRYTNSSLYTFANMVFAATTKIGCAYKICPATSNAMTVSCLYNQIGYYTNAVMWVTGTACASAADCTTYPSSDCSASLCTISAATAGTSAPATTTATSGTGNTICPGNAGMPDNIRQTLLYLHNSYRWRCYNRSSVALGLEPDAFGGNAPKASKMLRMKYDCAIEASAISYANKCVYEHSADSERPGLGENLFATTKLIEAAQGWWEELKVNGVGPSNNLTETLWDRPNKQIGHYTQMAWDTSYRLGCAVVNCPSFTFVNCQYGPSGNIVNSLIYTIGTPCSGCPSASNCSTTEGLCSVP